MRKAPEQVAELRETIEVMEKKAQEPMKQRVSLTTAQEEQNVIKELAMIILSKNLSGDVQDRVAGVLRRTYGDTLSRNEQTIQELQQKNSLLSKQLDFESFDCIPRRVLDANEVLQVAAKTVAQAKPQILQEYVEMQSTQSEQEEDLLTRQSLQAEETASLGSGKGLQRSGNQSTKSMSNYFSPKNREEDLHFMLLLQAITIEEYIMNSYQSNEQGSIEELEPVRQQQKIIEPASHPPLRPQFSFNNKEKN